MPDYPTEEAFDEARESDRIHALEDSASAAAEAQARSYDIPAADLEHLELCASVDRLVMEGDLRDRAQDKLRAEIHRIGSKIIPIPDDKLDLPSSVTIVEIVEAKAARLKYWLKEAGKLEEQHADRSI